MSGVLLGMLIVAAVALSALISFVVVRFAVRHGHSSDRWP
jgi:hypothetical protein